MKDSTEPPAELSEAVLFFDPGGRIPVCPEIFSRPPIDGDTDSCYPAFGFRAAPHRAGTAGGHPAAHAGPGHCLPAVFLPFPYPGYGPDLREA